MLYLTLKETETIIKALKQLILEFPSEAEDKTMLSLLDKLEKHVDLLTKLQKWSKKGD